MAVIASSGKAGITKTTGSATSWSFLTSHALILVCLRRDPGMRHRDLAAETGLTERTIKTVIDDLIAAGYVTRTRVGRRNTYDVILDRHFRHETLADEPLDDFIGAVGHITTFDYQDVIDTVAHHVVEFLGDACVISVINEDGTHLDPVAVRHPDPKVTEFMRGAVASGSIPIGEGLSGKVAATGQATLLSEFPDGSATDVVAPSAVEFAERYGIASVVIVPLTADGETIGTLGALRAQPGRPYTDDDQQLLERFGRRAALAIRDARLKRADIAAEAFEALYRTNLDGVLISTNDGRLLAANPAACAMFKRTEDDIIRGGRPALVDPQDPTVTAGLAERDRTGQVQGTVTFRRRGGTTFLARAQATIFHTAAGEQRVCTIIRDLT